MVKGSKRLMNQDYRMLREITLDKKTQEKEDKKEKLQALQLNLQLAWDKEKFLHEKQEINYDKCIEQMSKLFAEGNLVADVGLLL